MDRPQADTDEGLPPPEWTQTSPPHPPLSGPSPSRGGATPTSTSRPETPLPDHAHPSRLFIDIGSWLLTVAITLLGLVGVTFFIGRVLPIDPVLSIVGERRTPEVYQSVYLELGLDKPIWQQFCDYVTSCCAVTSAPRSRPRARSSPT